MCVNLPQNNDHLMNTPYQPELLELSAQDFWRRNNAFQSTEDNSKEKFYCLSMLPYPSGSLHMGHVRNYTIGDVASRYQHFQGKNVLQPMGWDAFGLPAENAALKHKVAPSGWTESNIASMKQQLIRLGFAYDWSREFTTCKPSYYRWEQWLFTQLYEKGLVYRKKTAVNWDPVDQTVLANEQVVDGKGWRSGAAVERREISQWFLKTTAYADQLLDSIDDLDDWPENVKTMQRNWIGKSQGCQLRFQVKDTEAVLEVFTTRPDTLMGVSFMAISAEHPLAKRCAKDNPSIQAFIQSCQHTKVAEAELAIQEKRGIATPFQAIHPLTKQNIPVWIGNFVLSDYGSGAVMAVPAHDTRDHAFAKQYELPILPVIHPDEAWDFEQAPFIGQGKLMHSGPFDGLTHDEAKKVIIEALKESDSGEPHTQFRLRDWGVSRQRYWGCPIPMLYDDEGNITPVHADDLPIELPTDVALSDPQSPLPQLDSFVNAEYKGKQYRRETDTFDTFVESSWYYLRYCCPNQDQFMLDERADYWAPVDLYIGGIEHAVMHLLYARFMHKVLRDLGLIKSDEPFKQLLTQGMVLKDGTKMSKSKGNTVDPTALIERYGADTLRFFICFAAPPEQSFEWSDGGVEGSHRFLKRFWQFANEQAQSVQACQEANEDTMTFTKEVQAANRAFNLTLKQAQHDMDRLQYNTVASACMKMLNILGKASELNNAAPFIRTGLRALCIVLNPITPHITHHLWQHLAFGEDILNAQWPKVDEKALTALSEISYVIQINGKKRGEIEAPAESDEAELMQLVHACDSISKHLLDKTIIKKIVIPNKLINIVVK